MGNRRWEIMVRLLNGRGKIKGAEVGVFRGQTSAYMLKHLPGLRMLYCVDAWQHYPDHTATLRPGGKFIGADMVAVKKDFLAAVHRYRDRVKVMHLFSMSAAKLIPDKSLDFVFIDGNHAYEYVVDDIKVWGLKIKPGGLLAGHDWNIKGYKHAFGVNRAVKELVPGHQNIRYVWYKEVL